MTRQLICKQCVMQYYNGAWTYHPEVKLGLSTLTATRDLIEQSVRTQLLALKPNVSIRGGAIAEELLWDNSKITVQGEPWPTGTEVSGYSLSQSRAPATRCWRSKRNVLVRGSAIPGLLGPQQECCARAG